MGHRQTQHQGRSEGDDRDLRGRDTEGPEDEALEAAAPEVNEAQRIQELVDAARGTWTASNGSGRSPRSSGGRGPAKGSGRGNRRRGDSGR